MRKLLIALSLLFPLSANAITCPDEWTGQVACDNYNGGTEIYNLHPITVNDGSFTYLRFYYSDFTTNYPDAVNNATEDYFGVITGLVNVAKSHNSRLTTLEAGNPKTFNNPTRSLNSVFQISATKDAGVSYSVDISASLSLTGGATGTVFLEYADDSAFTTNVKEVSRFANGNTGTLTIGLNITQLATGTVSGFIPAGKYVRLRTANTAGSPSFTYRNAQEVLL